ncbi:MAG TPA: WYL domain-containing protein [Bacilli bacterium]|nr:WYL domain-containing protein [Bacilli bacterium]
MGKFSNMLFMIDLLNTGNKYSIKELSQKLGVTERMIRYYKEELENNGIFIESFKGPNGGYFMLDRVKNYISFNKYDVQLLENISEVLEKSNFPFMKSYKDLLEKAKNMYSIAEEKSKFIVDIKSLDNNEIFNIVKSSIKKQEAINIEYRNIDGTISKRTIHPLQLFNYKDINYVTAYCELRKDIRHFEIERIENIK